jgi:hypothetical protein
VEAFELSGEQPVPLAPISMEGWELKWRLLELRALRVSKRSVALEQLAESADQDSTWEAKKLFEGLLSRTFPISRSTNSQPDPASCPTSLLVLIDWDVPESEPSPTV